MHCLHAHTHSLTCTHACTHTHKAKPLVASLLPGEPALGLCTIQARTSNSQEDHPGLIERGYETQGSITTSTTPTLLNETRIVGIWSHT